MYFKRVARQNHPPFITHHTTRTWLACYPEDYTHPFDFRGRGSNTLPSLAKPIEVGLGTAGRLERALVRAAADEAVPRRPTPLRRAARRRDCHRTLADLAMGDRAIKHTHLNRHVLNYNYDRVFRVYL